MLVSTYYERYGAAWQRTEDARGFDGRVDAVDADTPGAVAYFKVHAGRSGHYQVRVHYPPDARAANARYDVFLTSYLTAPAGESALGEPLFSTTLDQSDESTWSTAVDEDGFVSIGDLDIAIEDGREVATVVVRLSSAESSDRRASESSTYLLADAVKLERLD